MINTNIIISINVHEKINFLLMQLDNIKNYVKDEYIVILNCNEYMYNELKNIVLDKNIIINSEIINKTIFTGTILQGITSNLKLATRNYLFKFFVILSSRTIFYNNLNYSFLMEKNKNFKFKNPDLKTWHFPFLSKMLLYKYFKNQNLEVNAHEGLCFSYNVCLNIVSFLRTHEIIEEDMYNFNCACEEFCLQTISANIIDKNNNEIGYFDIGNGCYEIPIENLNKNNFVYKIKRI